MAPGPRPHSVERERAWWRGLVESVLRSAGAWTALEDGFEPRSCIMPVQVNDGLGWAIKGKNTIFRTTISSTFDTDMDVYAKQYTHHYAVTDTGWIKLSVYVVRDNGSGNDRQYR